MFRFGIKIGKLGGTAITPQPTYTQIHLHTHANIPRRTPGVHRFHDNDGSRYAAARGVTQLVDDDEDYGDGEHNRSRNDKKTMTVSFGLLYYYYFRSADYRYCIYIYI